jgi:cyclic pyranopterin phosphate synthase
MLRDSYQRKIRYLRVSLTDKCNLRCAYCMPPEGVEFLPHDEVLRNEEFVHLIGLFVEMGVAKGRLTGGEPLVRKGFIDIVSKVRELFPDLEICLTTNGVLLGPYLEKLNDLAVRKINISLDTLNRERYARITGRDYLPDVLASIERAQGIGGFNIKLNAVLFRETLSELADLLGYAASRNLVLRFIERMPFIAEEEGQRFVPGDDLVEALKQYGTIGRDCEADTNVALMYHLEMHNNEKVRIGIIPPMTHKFCARCDRLRLTSDGHLKTCLYSRNEYDLKTLYRQDMGDEKIVEMIRAAVNEKPREHGVDCAEYGAQGCASILSIRTMSKIGG